VYATQEYMAKRVTATLILNVNPTCKSVVKFMPWATYSLVKRNPSKH